MVVILRFLCVLFLAYSICKANVDNYETYVSDSHEDFHPNWKKEIFASLLFTNRLLVAIGCSFLDGTRELVY